MKAFFRLYFASFLVVHFTTHFIYTFFLKRKRLQLRAKNEINQLHDKKHNTQKLKQLETALNRIFRCLSFGCSFCFILIDAIDNICSIRSDCYCCCYYYFQWTFVLHYPFRYRKKYWLNHKTIITNKFNNEIHQ